MASARRADACASDDANPDDAIIWQLRVRGQVARLPYEARFEVPVF